MPYRLLRRNSELGQPDPTWCYVVTEQRHDRYDDRTYARRGDAERALRDLSRSYPRCDYVVVGSPNAYRWDDLFARYTSSDTPTPVVDEDEDICDHCDYDCGEQGLAYCDHCGEHGHHEDSHEWHECENCGYQCGVPDCTECVSWGPDSDWCEGCAEDHYADEEGRTGSPGLALRECSTCHSHDVHHDDIAEVFVCDCQARRLLADRRPVTLAHPLPTLAEVA